MTLVLSDKLKLFCLEVIERLKAFNIDYQCCSEPTGSAGKNGSEINEETIAMSLFFHRQ